MFQSLTTRVHSKKKRKFFSRARSVSTTGLSTAIFIVNNVKTCKAVILPVLMWIFYLNPYFILQTSFPSPHYMFNNPYVFSEKLIYIGTSQDFRDPIRPKNF